MRLEYTQEQLSELKYPLKDKANAMHHRKLQAIILYAEGMSLIKAGGSTGFVQQTVRNLSNRCLTHELSATLKEGRGHAVRTKKTHAILFVLHAFFSKYFHRFYSSTRMIPHLQSYYIMLFLLKTDRNIENKFSESYLFFMRLA